MLLLVVYNSWLSSTAREGNLISPAHLRWSPEVQMSKEVGKHIHFMKADFGSLCYISNP